MNLYKTYKTNDSLEKEGTLIEVAEGVKMRIARAGGNNTRYGKLLGERMKPHRRQMENGTLDDKVADRIIYEIYADTVILGWEGVTDQNDKPLEYTRENCIKLLTDLPDLFREIQEHATKLENFRQAALEEDVKN